MAKRNPISARLRYEVLRRDGFTCQYCGAKAPDVELQIDHVVPVSLGGDDHPSNLVASCVDCNIGKASTMPSADTVEEVAASSDLWGKALEAVERGDSPVQKPNLFRGFEDEIALFDGEWWSWHYTDDAESRVPRPDDWKPSLRAWLLRGLPLDRILSMIPVAMNSKASPDDKWRYFCGCVWKTLTDWEDEVQSEHRRLAELEVDG